MKADPRAPWSDLMPQDLIALFSRVPCTWWIAGGWALDLFLGRVSRPHGDLDVGCFRDEAKSVQGALGHWELFAAADGMLRPLRPGDPPADGNSLWCRRAGHVEWDVQVMFEDRARGEWRFRRDASVRRAERQMLWQAPGGLRVLAPEIQLLYKGKDVRPKDQADFDATYRLLAPPARQWLARALRQAYGPHPWIPVLEAGEADVGLPRPRPVPGKR